MLGGCVEPKVRGGLYKCFHYRTAQGAPEALCPSPGLSEEWCDRLSGKLEFTGWGIIGIVAVDHGMVW